MDRLRLFNIEDFSIDDGPGVRTVVFFKGCSLHCRWCHNPESISPHKQVLVYERKCIGCGACFAVCPTGANRVDEAGHHVIDQDKCAGCMACVGECFAGALVQAGDDAAVEDVFARVLRNKPYFDQSSGGLTTSGGECMLQIEPLRALLRLCHDAGIHTAVDTAGNVPWPSFEAIIPFTDLFLYDIKAMDSAVHRACTGAGNERILENFERLYGRGCDIRVRIPYIPGWNDGELDAIAAYLRRFPRVQAELLGYHELGNSKYRALGLEPIQAYSPTKNEIDALKARYGFI